MRRCTVGGQAVMEGVMMRSDEGIAMAVRRSDGKIVKNYRRYKSKAQRGTFLGLPIVRGVVAFVESLTVGMNTTTKSAELYGEDLADEEPSRFEKWLSEKLHIDVMDVVMGIGIFLGVILAVGLFMFLPQLISSLIFGKADSSHIWRSLVEGGLRVLIYVGYLFFCSAIKDVRRVFMYHGAEHKTIACYEADREPLTPQNAIKYSRLHPRCGTNYLFLVMAVSIIVLTLVDVLIRDVIGFSIDNKVLEFLFRFGYRILCLPFIAGISYEVLRAAAAHDNWLTKIIRAPGMALQYITTKEPTEDMLEVAIASFYLAMGEDDPLASSAQEDDGAEESADAPSAEESAEESADADPTDTVA